MNSKLFAFLVIFMLVCLVVTEVYGAESGKSDNKSGGNDMGKLKPPGGIGGDKKDGGKSEGGKSNGGSTGVPAGGAGMGSIASPAGGAGGGSTGATTGGTGGGSTAAPAGGDKKDDKNKPKAAM